MLTIFVTIIKINIKLRGVLHPEFSCLTNARALQFSLLNANENLSCNGRGLEQVPFSA